MNMPLADVIDRYTICLLKHSHAHDDAQQCVIASEMTIYLDDLMDRPYYDDLHPYIQKLYNANKDIWELESAIRQAKEDELGLEEVGRRALAIRDHNAVRIGIKNEISQQFGDGFKEYKIDHASETE